MTGFRKILARLKEIVQREGAKSLWFRAMAMIGYRRVIYLEMPIQAKSKNPVDATSIEIKLLKPQDSQAYAAFRRGALASDFVKRLESGRLCYAAMIDNQIASVSWVATNRAVLWLLDGEFDLANRECYLFDSFTREDFRGQKIQSFLFEKIRAWCLETGLDNVVTFVVPENFPNLRSRNRQGFRATGMVRMIRVGPFTKYISSGAAPHMFPRPH